MMRVVHLVDDEFLSFEVEGPVSLVEGQGAVEWVRISDGEETVMVKLDAVPALLDALQRAAGVRSPQAT